MKRTRRRAWPNPEGRGRGRHGAWRRAARGVAADPRPVTILKPSLPPGDPTNVPSSRTHQSATPDASTREPRANRSTRARAAGTCRARGLRALLLIPALLAAAALAGCFSIIGQTTVQEGDIGDVIVTTDMCLNGGTAGCEAGLTETADGQIQYLIGYLIPTWAVEPPSISWRGDAGNLTLARSVDYESILQGFAPAPLGQRWVGYTTDARPAPPIETDQRMQAVARIGVPDSAPGTLQLATVTGWRLVRDSAGGTRDPLPITRAYNCAETTDGTPSTRCILSGAPEQSTSPGQTPTADAIRINTLSLGAAAPIPTVRAGSTAVLKFPLATSYRGEGNDVIPMKVSSTLKGAKFEFPPNVILGQAPPTAEVRVTVPLIAETGDYTVTISTANGIRSATGALRVVSIRSLIAPTSTGSVSTLRESAVQLRTYLRQAQPTDIRRGNTFDLPVTVPAAGKLTGVLTSKGKVLSRGTKTARLPGAINLAIKPTPAAKDLLRRGKPLKGRLTLTFRPSSGKAQKAALSVSLG